MRWDTRRASRCAMATATGPPWDGPISTNRRRLRWSARSLVFRGFCRSCSGGGPGCENGAGFLRGGLLRTWAAKSGGDDDAAELDGHVVVGGFGLRGVPAGPRSVTGYVVGCVSVQRVPDGDHAETDQPERHRSFHGAACPVAGLADSDDLAGVGEGLLDSPP